MHTSSSSAAGFTIGPTASEWQLHRLEFAPLPPSAAAFGGRDENTSAETLQKAEGVDGHCGKAAKDATAEGDKGRRGIRNDNGVTIDADTTGQSEAPTLPHATTPAVTGGRRSAAGAGKDTGACSDAAVARDAAGWWRLAGASAGSDKGGDEVTLEDSVRMRHGDGGESGSDSCGVGVENGAGGGDGGGVWPFTPWAEDGLRVGGRMRTPFGAAELSTIRRADAGTPAGGQLGER